MMTMYTNPLSVLTSMIFLHLLLSFTTNEFTLPMIQLNPSTPDYDTTKWKELTASDGFVIDIKYATTDNFVKEKIYPCARFFLRPKVADALLLVNKELKTQGYRLKLFDGYRPRPAQQNLWDKVPDPNYVAPPSKGSMHNRGVAVDLTITDMTGKEFNMGTPYDFFGPQAHHDYTNLPKEVLQIRTKLKAVMEKHGFQSIRTEWWHYSFATGSYPLDDWQWRCRN
jgi:D-alanyl-D-alanine dipeptidase